jgi:hypothetical protein
VNGNLYVTGNAILNANTLITGNLFVNGVRITGGIASQWAYTNPSTNSGNIYYMGNIGIGTSNPQYNLDVSGTANVNGNLYVTGNAILNANTVITGNLFVNGVRITGGIASQWTSAPSGNIYFLGNVGINRLDPQYPTDISGITRIVNSNGAIILQSLDNKNNLGVVYNSAAFTPASTAAASNNTAIGAGALNNLAMQTSTNMDNTAIGYNTLSNIGTTSVNNTALGSSAASNLVGSMNNTAIGFSAILFASQTTTNNNTAIGACTRVSTFGNSVAIGYSASATGGNSIAIGTGANSTAGNSIAIGYNASASAGNSVAIGVGASSTNIGQIVLGRATESVIIPGTNISTGSGSGALQIAGGFGVVGNSYIAGNLTVGGNITCGNLLSYAVYTSSDYRLKGNVQPISITRTIDILKPVEYDHITGHQMGFIAHEVQNDFPFLVTGQKDGAEYQSVNYNGFIALMVKEIQDLKQRMKEAEDTIRLLTKH